MEMTCPDCGMCKSHGNLNEIKKGQKDSNGFTKCWPGKHAEGTKKGKNGKPVRNCVPNESVAEAANAAQQAAIAVNMKKHHKKPNKSVSEGFNESPVLDKNMRTASVNDTGEQEGSFVKNQLRTIQRVSHHLSNELADTQDLPEWVEMKISQAQEMMVGVMDYVTSAKEIDMDNHGDSDSMMAEANAQFDMIEAMMEDLAVEYGIDSDSVWDLFETVSDSELLAETAAWEKSSGKNKNGGLNQKGVNSYRREHPGSKLQTAVTTKPSKLKKGSKAVKRRKSFCARMKGMKKHRTGVKTAHDPNSRINKSLRKWNC
jgi:hypothetical protein